MADDHDKDCECLLCTDKEHQRCGACEQKDEDHAGRGRALMLLEKGMIRQEVLLQEARCDLESERKSHEAHVADLEEEKGEAYDNGRLYGAMNDSVCAKQVEFMRRELHKQKQIEEICRKSIAEKEAELAVQAERIDELDAQVKNAYGGGIKVGLSINDVSELHKRINEWAERDAIAQKLIKNAYTEGYLESSFRDTMTRDVYKDWAGSSARAALKEMRDA